MRQIKRKCTWFAIATSPCHVETTSNPLNDCIFQFSPQVSACPGEQWTDKKSFIPPYHWARPQIILFLWFFVLGCMEWQDFPLFLKGKNIILCHTSKCTSQCPVEGYVLNVISLRQSIISAGQSNSCPWKKSDSIKFNVHITGACHLIV